MDHKSDPRQQEARQIIKRHVLYCMGGSLIPIPIADLAAVTAIQIEMLKQLSGIYAVEFKPSASKAIITALSGNVLARLGASLFKALPGVGTLLGGASLVVLTGGATYALGEVFIDHVSRGGNFDDFDTEAYRRFYNEKYREGQTQAEAWKKEENQKQGTARKPGKTIEIEPEDDNS